MEQNALCTPVICTYDSFIILYVNAGNASEPREELGRKADRRGREERGTVRVEEQSSIFFLLPENSYYNINVC